MTIKHRIQQPSTEQLLMIHNAIHGEDSLVTINNIEYPIIDGKNGCRRCDFMGIRFIEQNKNKESSYAREAREGAKITWGIRVIGPWIYIKDGHIH